LLLISFFSFQKLTRQAIMIVLPFTANHSKRPFPDRNPLLNLKTKLTEPTAAAFTAARRK